MSWNSHLSPLVLPLLLSSTLSLGLSFAHVEKAWEARHDGPRGRENDARAVALDTTGNLYVAGSSGMVKYDPDGQQLWVVDSWLDATALRMDSNGNVFVMGLSGTAKYDPDGNQLWVADSDLYFIPTALDVDTAGNLYVTGSSECPWLIPVPECSIDYVTAKFDPEGKQLWVARYDGPAGWADYATALGVDSFGNTYVTGGSGTIKYGPGGNLIWAADSEFSATAVEVTSDGNVYVLGSTRTVKYDVDGNRLWLADSEFGGTALTVDGTGYVYVMGPFGTAKYDPDGNQLWVVNSEFSATALEVDEAGNVYITGSPETGLGDYVTVKYDFDGNRVWLARYDGPGRTGDQATALAVDPAGNVYVTGRSGFWGEQSPIGDYATVKYDPAGNEFWVARYEGPGAGDDYAEALALDSSGNVYIAGSSGTIKYNPDGNQVWEVDNQFSPTALAVDPAENVYMTGWLGDRGDAYVTVKYDPMGNEIWVAHYDGPQGDRATALALDVAGNVYVTGWSGFWSPAFPDSGEYATVKYDSEGNERWVTRYNGPGRGGDAARALTLDPAGNVYVTGGSWGGDPDKGGTGWDYATIKYDPEGNEVWVARYDGHGGAQAAALAVDVAGNVYVTGRTGPPATVKYDPDGNEVWTAERGGGSVAVDETGNVYVTGWFWWDFPSGEYATVKFDSEGRELWVSDRGGGAIVVDPDGSVYVPESSSTVKFDPDGNELWATDQGGSALAVDDAGNVYVTGSAWGGDPEEGGTGQDYLTVKYVQFSSNNFRRGDSNIDRTVDISDPVTTLEVLFLGKGEITCEDAADSNDDGLVDISDAINTLGALFLGNASIPLPGTEICGFDPTGDELDCQEYGACE